MSTENKPHLISDVIHELSQGDFSLAKQFLEDLQAVGIASRRIIQFGQCPNGDIFIKFLKSPSETKEGQDNP